MIEKKKKNYSPAALERRRAYSREWNKKNRAKVMEGLRKFWNTEHGRAQLRKWNKNWRTRNARQAKDIINKWHRDNPGKRSAKDAARRCRRLKATPKWVDAKKIKAIYIRAAELGLTVDHIVPLKHELVCGLHVPWNLQLLSKADNARKSNHFVI